MANDIIEELDDDEYRDIQEAKRHKEMLSVLKEVSNELKSNKNKQVEELLSKNNQIIDSLVLGIQKLQPKQEKKENNHAEVVSAIQSMAKQIKDGLSEIKKTIIETEKEDEKEEPMKEWSFDIVRNSLGYIQKVNAKQIK